MERAKRHANASRTAFRRFEEPRPGHHAVGESRRLESEASFFEKRRGQAERRLPHGQVGLRLAQTEEHDERRRTASKKWMRSQVERDA